GSELRVDAGVGADPNFAAALYKPLNGSAVFARAAGMLGRRTFNFVQDDVTVAEYGEQRQTAVLDAGVNVSRRSELSGGLWFSHVSDTIRAGDPGLPEISGGERGLHLRWVFD